MTNQIVVEADPGTSTLPLEQFLPDRIAVLASAISRGLGKIYARYDLGVSEWRVLAALAEGGELTAKSIGLRTRMHKTKISRAVSLLSARELINRRANHTDHRQTILSLTPEGANVFRETVPLATEFGQKLESAIPLEDRAAFERCMLNLQQRTAELAGAVSDLDADH